MVAPFLNSLRPSPCLLAATPKLKSMSCGTRYQQVAEKKDAEFEVAEDATKAQIKTAFVKSLKIKKLNKKVLGEFVTLIA